MGRKRSSMSPAEKERADLRGPKHPEYRRKKTIRSIPKARAAVDATKSRFWFLGSRTIAPRVYKKPKERKKPKGTLPGRYYPVLNGKKAPVKRFMRVTKAERLASLLREAKANERLRNYSVAESCLLFALRLEPRVNARAQLRRRIKELNRKHRGQLQARLRTAAFEVVQSWEKNLGPAVTRLAEVLADLGEVRP